MTTFIPGIGLHFRPPTDDELAFSFQLSWLTDYDDHDATSDQSTVDDALVEQVTTEYSDPIYDLLLSGETDGVTIEVLDATGSLDGVRLSRVSNGICRVRVSNWLKTTVTTFDMSRINGNTHEHLVSYVSGSLARHIVDGMTTLIGSKTSAAKPIYTTQNHGAATYVRNAACWAALIDLTAISPWNSRGGATRAGTAITPRHTIQATHYPLAIGDTLRFVTADNTVITRTVSNVATVAVSSSDTQIALLDSDLPASITPLQFLPADVADYLPSLEAWPLPILALDAQEHAITKETNPAKWNVAVAASRFTDAINEPFNRMTEPIIGGDSGNPICMVANGEAVLLSHWSVSEGGTAYHMLLTEIAAAIATLGGGHSLQTVDLSSFPTY